MHDASYRFLKSLLTTPSPSGYEQRIQEVVRVWARPLADDVRTDLHGNVIAAINPTGSPRIMLAGHCDQLALMVQHIDSDGFLYVQPMGGWDMQILLGHRLSVWSRTGPITGVVSRKAPHILTADERKKIPEFVDIWIDIGARDRAEAETLVALGDTITVELSCQEMRNGLLTSPGCDDKVGVWTVMETLRLLHGRPLQAAVFCVSTVQEEIGLRGAHTSAYGIHPTVGIAVDVTHATDTPGNEKKQLGETKLNAGPVVFRGPNINPHVHERLAAIAKEKEITIQTRGAAKATGTDANAIQLARAGVAAGLVSIPNRYMHSPVEVVGLTDLDSAARLLAEFCLSVTEEMSWIP
ncbi:MAG: M42 family metallopeptidase [Planctomycetes bacterium]|nr:M42 family metallopeptidase [Planctomycetota bacterium]